MIVDIWKTSIYLTKVDEHEDIKKAFLPYITDEYLTRTWPLSPFCFSTLGTEKNKDLPWDIWMECVAPKVIEMITELKPRVPIKLELVESWLNSYTQGGFQEIHDHLHSGRSLSCAYFLEWTESAGEIVFENSAMSLNNACSLPQLLFDVCESKYVPQIEEGTLIVFPSWVKHFTMPNFSKERRSTISANFSIYSSELEKQ